MTDPANPQNWDAKTARRNVDEWNYTPGWDGTGDAPYDNLGVGYYVQDLEKALANALERAEKAEADYQEARDTHDRLRADRDSNQREAIRAMERAEKAEAALGRTLCDNCGAQLWEELEDAAP